MSALGGFALRWGEQNLPPVGTFALLLALIALAFAMTIRWWGTLDFMQRDAQLAAWYWGGTGGAVLVLIGLLALSGKGLLVQGAALMLGGQAAGFFVFWLLWHLRHRGHAA
jgi:hypothetical protein